MPSAAPDEKMRLLEGGIVLTRYYLRRRPEKMTFKVKLDTRELIWIKVAGQYKPEGTVDLRLLKEIRLKDADDKETKEFDKWSQESGRNPELCLSLHYGDQFVLKHLSLQAQNQAEMDILVSGLTSLRASTQNASFGAKIDRWLKKEFHELKGRAEFITLPDIKKWLCKAYSRISTQKLKDYFKECHISTDGAVSFDDFANIYHKIVYTDKIFKDYFETYSNTSGGEAAYINPDRLSAFLTSENHQHTDVDAATRLMVDLLDDPMRSACGLKFSSKEFMNYLFSTENTIWDEQTTKVYEDMDQPMSHYFISSSHNTYLQGDQIKSNSSVEAYIQSLRMGARCIELDCWDGPDGYPHIYHGRTLTSKIKFVDVVKGIKKYAWQFSDYPIVLSIENHCTIPQQKKMAEVFLAEFGDDLLVAPVDWTADMLPSPNQLKRKFILKHKKLTGDWKLGQQGEDLMDILDINHGDISQSRKTGLLYLQDPVNSDEWNPHFFMLTNTGLYFTEQTDINNEEDAEEEEGSDNVPMEQRHLYEPWYHGRLPDGRNTGDHLLAQHQHLGPATFLVRESDTFVGSYTLSFWQHNKSNHCRVKTKQEHGKTKYYLVETLVFNSLYQLVEYYKTHKLRSHNFELSLKEPVPKIQSPRGKEHNNRSNHSRIQTIQDGGVTKYYLVRNLIFDSLYELIEFYKHNVLRTQNFDLCLREPVPKVPSPEGKPWYHEQLSREQAEEWLARIPKDGAFLIRGRGRGSVDRNSVDSAHQATISFRAENKIKHCRIIIENTQYCIGSAQFDSLPDLVTYYQKHPLYRKMKLRYAVNQALVDKCGENDLDVSIYGCGIYTQPNEVQASNVQCRALYSREPDAHDEMRLQKGDVIVNVSKRNADWWMGDHGDQIGKWFPANYAELIEDGLGSLQQGSISLNKLSKTVPLGSISASTSDSITSKTLYCFELHHNGDETLKIGAADKSEVTDWIIELDNCTKEAFKQNKEKAVLQKKCQIAEEFSNLIIYCRSTPYNPEGAGSYCDMTSFSEIKAEKTCTKKDNKGKQFLMYNVRQFSRIYPKGQRIDSSNYDPILPWSCGAHMLALNFQTPDKAMQINQGRFMQNGLCGYVLQPKCLNDARYDPFDKRSLYDVNPMTISLIILAGRHLFKQGKGIPTPFVEVEILGAYYEETRKFKTEKKPQNALAPVWNEATDFDIVNPDLAMIRFCVQDEDTFGDPYFLGQATIPVRCLKPGYRSIPLLNDYSEELELASLLVKVEIVNPQETEYSGIYSALSDLRDQKRNLEEKFNEVADLTAQTQLMSRLRDVNCQIDEQLNHRRKRVPHPAIRPRQLSTESRRLMNKSVDLPSRDGGSDRNRSRGGYGSRSSGEYVNC